MRSIKVFVAIIFAVFLLSGYSDKVLADEYENGDSDDYEVVYPYIYEDFLCSDNDENGVTIKQYKGTGGDVIIPSEINGKKVVCIGYKAFYDCQELTSVIIPNGVVKIEAHAFDCCINLREITIPEGVVSIGDGAFYKCWSLKEITLPSSITDIGMQAFYYCSGLTEILIPDGVTILRTGLMEHCDNLRTVYLPDSLTTIWVYAFSNCENLKEITIPESVTTIEQEAFRGCKELQEITIPENVTEIGKYVFAECDKLRKVVFLSADTLVMPMSDCFIWSPLVLIYTYRNSLVAEQAKNASLPCVYMDEIKGSRKVDFDKINYKTTIDETITMNFSISEESYEALSSAVENIDCKTYGNILIEEFDIDVLPNADEIEEYKVNGYIKIKGIAYDSNAEVMIRFSDYEGIVWSYTVVVDEAEEIRDVYKKKECNVSFKNEAELLEGDIDINLSIPWGLELFETNAKSYNNNIAIPSLVMSRQAEAGKSEIQNCFRELSLSNIRTYNYDEGNTVGNIAYAIASKEYIYHGRKKVFVVIVCRGTVGLNDALTDISSIVGSFSVAANLLKENLDNYMDIYKFTDNYDSSDITFLVTGHSLGGAVANLVATRLESYTSSQNIFAYTFAAPCTRKNGANRNNIFNILNVEDQVPHMPTKFSDKPRNGIDIWFDRDNDINIYEKFQNLTGLTGDKGLQEVMGSWKFYESTPIIGQKFKYAHANKTYMSYLLTRTDYYSSKKIKIKMVKVACPVDVEIYAPSGELIGRIKDNKIDESVQQGVLMCVDGDDKYIYMIYDGEYTVKLSGTDSGTMTYSVQDVNVETGEVEEEKVFKNIALEKGKEMVSTVSNDSENTSESIKNVEIYVTDGEGNNISKIGEDGKETSLTTPSPTATATPVPTTTPTAKPTDKPSSEPDHSPSPKATEQPSGSQPTAVPTQTPNPQVKVPKKPTLKSVKNTKGKKLTVKWKKVTGVNGYQVQYALNKSFTKSKKSKTLTKTTFTKKGLKKKKTYYVRVRAYVTDSNNKKVYGEWSKVKKVKIKK